MEIPTDFAALKEIHKGANGIFIFHIEDPHSNLSGQENLSFVLKRLSSLYGISLVLVEGSSKEGTLTPLKKLASKKNIQRAAKSFFIQGKLAGEEYLNLTSDIPLKIRGIEDRALYFKNLKSCASLVKERQNILEYLKKVQASLEKLKKKHYPQELLEYEKGGEQDEKKIEKFLRISSSQKISFEPYPNIQRLKSLKEKETSMDFNLIHLEHQALLDKLATSSSSPNTAPPLSSPKSFVGDPEFGARQWGDGAKENVKFAYFQNTLNTAKDKNIDLKPFSHFLAYTGYLKKLLEIDFGETLDELETAERELYKSLLLTKDSKLVRSIDRFVSLLMNAYSIRMTSKDFNLLQASRKHFKTVSCLAFINRKLAELGYFEDLISYKDILERNQKAIEDFYRTVDKRDLAFLWNAERILKEENQNMAVLVTGGYHTEHLTKLMKDKGYSYIVLTPHVTQETNHTKYEKLLLGAGATKKAAPSFSHSQQSTLRAMGFVMDPVENVPSFGGTAGTAENDPEILAVIKEFEGRVDNPPYEGARLPDEPGAGMGENQSLRLINEFQKELVPLEVQRESLQDTIQNTSDESLKQMFQEDLANVEKEITKLQKKIKAETRKQKGQKKLKPKETPKTLHGDPYLLPDDHPFQKLSKLMREAHGGSLITHLTSYELNGTTIYVSVGGGGAFEYTFNNQGNPIQLKGNEEKLSRLMRGEEAHSWSWIYHLTSYELNGTTIYVSMGDGGKAFAFAQDALPQGARLSKSPAYHLERLIYESYDNHPSRIDRVGYYKTKGTFLYLVEGTDGHSTPVDHFYVIENGVPRKLTKEEVTKYFQGKVGNFREVVSFDATDAGQWRKQELSAGLIMTYLKQFEYERKSKKTSSVAHDSSAVVKSLSSLEAQRDSLLDIIANISDESLKADFRGDLDRLEKEIEELEKKLKKTRGGQKKVKQKEANAVLPKKIEDIQVGKMVVMKRPWKAYRSVPETIEGVTYQEAIYEVVPMGDQLRILDKKKVKESFWFQFEIIDGIDRSGGVGIVMSHRVWLNPISDDGKIAFEGVDGARLSVRPSTELRNAANRYYELKQEMLKALDLDDEGEFKKLYREMLSIVEPLSALATKAKDEELLQIAKDILDAGAISPSLGPVQVKPGVFRADVIRRELEGVGQKEFDKDMRAKIEKITAEVAEELYEDKSERKKMISQVLADIHTFHFSNF
ncbi:MAG: hypothetical protein HY593_04870, partial [Candidatus Omnitrophica bacterium]|nr:hypothetical protein [Candidatus Omnitrophota bacterium]